MNDAGSRKPEAVTPLPADAPPSRRLRVRPLLALLPYVMRYRGQVAGALVALLVAAAATLIVPLAVRRMIDQGFSAERIGLIDQYFAVMIAIAGVLALASATRYYLVTIIGERVVADLRAAVFAHLTLLAPAFFDSAKTGELTSRLTADTTQIKSAVGSSVSVALRNLVLFIGSSVMMAVTRRAGVTSNAGWRAGTSSGAMRVVPACFTSSGSRSSMGISFPEASDRSIVDSGAAT